MGTTQSYYNACSCTDCSKLQHYYYYNNDEDDHENDDHQDHITELTSPFINNNMNSSPPFTNETPPLCSSTTSSSSVSISSSNVSTLSKYSTHVQRGYSKHPSQQKQQQQWQHESKSPLSSFFSERTFDFFTNACCFNTTDVTTTDHNTHNHKDNSLKYPQQELNSHHRSLSFQLPQEEQLNKKLHELSLPTLSNNNHNDNSDNDDEHNEKELKRDQIFLNPCRRCTTNDTSTFDENECYNNNHATHEKMKRYIPLHDFDLDIVHPMKPPFLGISYWEDQDDHGHQEDQREEQHEISIPPPPPPLQECNNIYNEDDDDDDDCIISMYDEEIQNSFQNLDISNIVHPLSPPGTPDSHNRSGKSVRKVMIVDGESPTTPESFGSRDNVLVSFAPRRLFDNKDDEKCNDTNDMDDNCHANTTTSSSMIATFHNIHDYHEYGNDSHSHSSCHGTSRENGDESDILNPTALFLATPKPSFIEDHQNPHHHNHEEENNTSNYNSRNTTSDDVSIILKNGILTKSPTTSHKGSCNNSVRSPTLSPCLSESTPKSLHSTLTRDIPDGGVKKDKQSGIIRKHVNTLPSFRSGVPIRLKVTESYAGFSSSFVHCNENGDGRRDEHYYRQQCRDSDRNRQDMRDGSVALNTSNISMLSDVEQTDFFSYDPYFSLGQYLISTSNNAEYGNGLSVKMGEQYMTLQDKDGRVFCVTRSRHTFIPSSVIYSSKARYLGQTPSSHRPNINNHHYHGHDDDEVELYPWAMAKKVGRRMDHDVGIHLVVEPQDRKVGIEMVGGLFEKNPSYISRHGFDSKGGHSHTVMYRIVEENVNDIYGKTIGNGYAKVTKRTEIPCCIMLRDPVYRDVFDVTIAPGIDPLLVVCSMAVHFKMDVEPKLCDQ